MKIDEGFVREFVKETLFSLLKEGRYDNSMYAYNGKVDMGNNLGNNPLYVDNGNRTNNKFLRQASTIDYTGDSFRPAAKYSLSPNQFTIYKIKNFGTDSITSTLDLFGKDTRKLRKAIDLLNGGADRGGRFVTYRTVTLADSVSKAKRSGWMVDTFWEFSLDGGHSWNILKPEPIVNMKPSKFAPKE